MIEITQAVISPEKVIASVKNDECGCVVTYVGLIRNHSNGKKVATVAYRDDGNALQVLTDMAKKARKKFCLTEISIVHRTGVLQVGDINLVVAVAAGHREEGFAACKYIIDKFKENLPTHKTETYADSSVYLPGANK